MISSRLSKLIRVIPGFKMAEKYSALSEQKVGNKTLHLTGYGGYDKMKVVELPRPKPGKDEVLVNIKANGINFAELMCRQGTYDTKPKTPAILGLEGAGVVVELGQGATDFKVGDKVICINSFGLWTEFAPVRVDRCFAMPDGMTFEEGAALPVNYITAHMMLFDFGNLRKGKSVLVHMAAGGVGIAATQLCKTVPNVTVFGTASGSKHDIIREGGCTHPIDYRTKDYVAEIRKIAPQGVDIVLDPLNGADAVKGYKLLKPLGKIIHFGAANVVTGPKMNMLQMAKTWWATSNHSPLNIIAENKAVCGYHLGHLVESPELIRECVSELIDLYNQGKIKPRIDSVWSYDEIASAMAQMHDRKNIGKVIICPHKPADSQGASKA